MNQGVEFLQLRLVGRTLRNAEIKGGKRQGFASGVENVDLALEFCRRVKDQAEAVERTFINVLVDGEGGRSPLVRNGALAARIEINIDPLVFDVAEVGQFRRLECVKHAFVAHDLDHVVARNGNVIAAELARFQGRQQGFVAVECVHGDFDIIFGSKLVQQLLRDVLEPMIDRELAFGMCAAGHRH